MNFSTGFKKYFFNTSWLMAERIFRMVVGLFVGVYVARYLGPAKFGLLSYTISFVALFLALSKLGLDGIVIRELVKTPERKNELLGTAFGLKICGVLLMWVAIALVSPLTCNDQQTTLLVSIIAFSAIFQIFNVIDLNYQAEVKAKLVVHAQFVQMIFSSIFKVSLILTDATLIWFAWAYLFDIFILSLWLTLIYIKKTGAIILWNWKSSTAITLLKDSWPLIFSGMLISIYMKIDQVMIKEMLGAVDVGHYAAAVKISEAWYFIPMAIAASLYPAIINAKKEGTAVYTRRLKSLYRLMFLLALAIALPISLLSTPLIDLLFGKAYQPAAFVLSIHIWAGIFIFMGVANSRRLLAENLQKYNMINTSIGAVINVILNIILIKEYGINGAAISTIISQSYATYLGLLLFSKTRQSFLDISTIFLRN